MAVLLVHGADEHAAGGDAHHLAGRQVDDGDGRLAHQLLGLVVLVDAREDHAVGAGAVVKHELEELDALGHGLALLDLDDAEVRLAEGVEVDLVLEERLDDHVGEVGLGEGGAGACGTGGVAGALGPHVREEQDVADGRLVGEEHDHAVDAKADAARRGHAVLEGAHVVEVVLHGLLVAGLLGRDLVLEATLLVDRVVELGERVGVLVVGHEELEALGEARVAGDALGQRRDLDGVVADEGGVDQARLAQLVEELVDEATLLPVLLPLDLEAVAELAQVLDGGVHGDGLAHALRDDLGHGRGAEGQAHVDHLALVLELLGQAHGLAARGEQALGELLHAIEVGEGAVGLHRGELGVVGLVHALVAEDASQLEDAVKAAHDAPLEVQLGGDAHVAVLVERVEVRGEGTRVGAAQGLLQDGGLDLDVALLVLHVATDRRDELGAHAEGVAHLGVHDHVGVALAVAGLAVGQAAPLVGQRTAGLGEHLDARGGDGDLAAARADHVAGGADDVAHVHAADEVPAGLAQDVDAAEELDLAGLVLDHDERDLALVAHGADAAGDAHDVRRVLAGLEALMLGDDVGGIGVDMAVGRVRVDAIVDHGLTPGATDGALVVDVDLRRLLGACLNVLLGHVLSPSARSPAPLSSCALAGYKDAPPATLPRVGR